MKPTPKERLACACFVLEQYALREDLACKVVIPLETNKRAMDSYNQLLKETPRLRKFIENEIQYITTYGRVVRDKEAKRIAIEAGQLDDTGLQDKDPLFPEQIWPPK